MITDVESGSDANEGCSSSGAVKFVPPAETLGVFVILRCSFSRTVSSAVPWN